MRRLLVDGTHDKVGDIEVTLGILNLFGEATGLKTNLQKSNVVPIRCGGAKLAAVQSLLLCALTDSPCKYLGLPLSLKKLTKEQVQPFIVASWMESRFNDQDRQKMCLLVCSSIWLWLLNFHPGLSK